MSQSLEGGFLCDIIDEDDSTDVSVIVRHHALPKTLLTRCIPQLKSEN